MRGRFTDDTSRPSFGQRRAYLLRTSPVPFSIPTTTTRAWSTKRIRSCRRRHPPPCARRARIIRSRFAKRICNCPRSIPRIPDLAKQITARDTNPYDKARAIESYLRSHYGYTLDLQRPAAARPAGLFSVPEARGTLRIFRRGHDRHAAHAGHSGALRQRIPDRANTTTSGAIWSCAPATRTAGWKPISRASAG